MIPIVTRKWGPCLQTLSICWPLRLVLPFGEVLSDSLGTMVMGLRDEGFLPGPSDTGVSFWVAAGASYISCISIHSSLLAPFLIEVSQYATWAKGTK